VNFLTNLRSAAKAVVFSMELLAHPASSISINDQSLEKVLSSTGSELRI
jgi:hypothetical protein